MKLQFESIVIENFKSFSGEHKFDLKALGTGLHFIRGRNEAEPRLGPNGAGKSSLWDALCWCLYGKTPDGSRNPDIQPWKGDKHTAVDVWVKVDREERTVTRQTHPNVLLIDDKPVGQEQVDALIGLSYATFNHAVLLGQGQPLFLDLEPRKKMELFSEVLDLERWELRSKQASTRMVELSQQMSMLEAVVESEQTNLTDHQAMHDKLKAQASEWRVTWGDKMRTAYEALEDVERKLKSAEAKYNEIEPKHDWTQAQMKLIRLDLHKLRNVSSVEFLERGRKAEVERGKSLDTCPTCGQSLDKKTAAKAKAELERILKGFNIELVKARKAAKERKALEDSLLKMETDADQLMTQLQPLHNTISQLKGQQSSLQRTLQEKEDETNPYHDQLTTLRRKISKAKAKLKESKALIAKLGRRIERARFWIKGFKDIRLNMIDEVLIELELATNAALEDVGLVGWSVNYEVEKITKKGTVSRGLNVLIKSPVAKKRVRWESWSGGESQRLRVVGALALSEVLLNHAGITTSLEILDEPAHFMAPVGVRDLTDYLAWRANGLERQTFYIDHMAIDSGRFSSVTTVVRDKNGARLEHG